MSVILLVLWALGMLAGSTVGAWVHLLFVFALLTVILAVVNSGRRAALR